MFCVGMSSGRLSESTELCTSCGLCCSGILYDSVPSVSHEFADLVELGLKPYEEPAGQLRFNLPCPHLSGTRCGVYDQRPGTCRRFQCELLKNLEKGELSLPQALARVQVAKEIIDEVSPAISKIEKSGTPKSWAALLERWKTNARTGADDPAGSQLMLRLAKLHRFLDIYFRSPDQQVLRPED